VNSNHAFQISGNGRELIKKEEQITQRGMKIQEKQRPRITNLSSNTRSKINYPSKMQKRREMISQKVE
jgi:hypothetical protein